MGLAPEPEAFCASAPAVNARERESVGFAVKCIEYDCNNRNFGFTVLRFSGRYGRLMVLAALFATFGSRALVGFGSHTFSRLR